MGNLKNSARLRGITFGAALLCANSLTSADASELTHLQTQIMAPIVQEIRTAMPEGGVPQTQAPAPDQSGQKELKLGQKSGQEPKQGQIQVQAEGQAQVQGQSMAPLVPQTAAVEPGDVLLVPIFALLSSPDKFTGKLVTTQGFMHFRDGDYELYPSKEFGNFRLSLDGLWLDFSRDEHRSGKSATTGINLTSLDDQYVNLTGIFDTKVKGRFNFSVGGFRGIAKITKIAADSGAKSAATPANKTPATSTRSAVSNASK